MAETAATEEKADAQDAAAVEVHQADLPEAPAQTVTAPGGQIDILLDTTMEVAVHLGQVAMPARQLVQLGPGSVLTLDKRAGEPVDLLLRGIKFATGKLVVVGEQLGVKIEQILPPENVGGPHD